MNNIVLCGFMGCGKSSVGKIIADLTGYSFVDTDQLTEQQEAMTISELFASRGEDGFRDAEHLACKKAAELERVVISTGGGALTFDRNVKLFNNDSVIFLDVDFDEVCRRIGDDGNRPLFRDKVKAKALFDTRLPLYRKAAHHTVDGVGTAEEVANRILTLLKKG